MSNKLIIFGNSGFIGSYIQKHFIDYEIFGFNSIDCDLLDIENIYKVFEQFLEPINIIIASSIVRTKENDFNSFDKNILMIENLSMVLLNTNIQVKHIIFLSSIDVYATQVNDVIDEKTLLNPMDFYSLSKLTSEFLLKNICNSKNISLSILRLPGVYGDNESNSTLGKFITNGKKGFITIYGDGNDERDFLYIEDLLKVIDICLKMNINDTINVVTGHSFSINDIVKTLKNHFYQCQIIYEISNDEKRQKTLKFDNKRLLKYLDNYQMISVIDHLNKEFLCHY